MKRKVKIQGATDAELSHGIGYRIEPPPAPGWAEDPLASRAGDARRGAAAMRSRMFAEASYRKDLPITMVFHPGPVQFSDLGLMRPGDRWFVAAWTEERELGCPAWPKR